MKNFIACDGTFDASRIVLFGVPFDKTCTYRRGSANAPAAIRAESYGIETFSPYLDRDLCDIKVCDAGDVKGVGNAAAMVKSTETFTAKIVVNGKFPVMLGGEHLVTLGAFQAVAKKYPDACIVHFDAHTDLRDNYEGEKLNHATVIRRCFDIVGANRIFQFGIRSGERQEFEFASKNTFLTKNNFDGLTNALKKIGNRPIYFTIDLDVLDPSEMGGTGTPEAGGVRFLELLDAAKKVFSANVVACDINELCPAVDTNGASTALACKFLREILLLVK